MIRTKMFTSIAVVVLALSVLCTASQVEAVQGSHTGIVQEVMNGGGYTYLKIEEKGNEFWIAAPETAVTKGSQVIFSEQGWMANFKNKALNRTFERILFVGSVHVVSSSPGSKGALQSKTSPSPKFVAKKDDIYTVEEIFNWKNELNGKIIKVRGKVVKVLKRIMKRTWVHIKDGTSSGDNKKVVFRTMTAAPAVGDEVTAQGTLELDKDFGFGYFYSVIVEDSTFSK